MSSKSSVVLLLIVCLLIILPDRHGARAQTPMRESRPVTQQTKLRDLSLELAQEFDARRTPLYFDLLSSNDRAQKNLNDNPNIQLMFIDRRGRPIYYQTNNLDAARTISTDDVWSFGSGGLSLDGLGTDLGRLCLWDGGGVRASHREFEGRVTQMDSPSGTSYHSTHVAGTMVAAGVDPAAKGMSHGALLAAYDWTDDEAEMASAAATGMNVSNHSYGFITGWYYEYEEPEWYWFGDVAISPVEDADFGFYGYWTRVLDSIAYYAPYYTIVKGAGNDRDDAGPGPGGGHYYWDHEWVWSTDTRDPDGGTSGYDCMSVKGCAKNIITVGAVDDIPAGYSQPSDVVMSSFSNWGPTDDGRVKPDIAGNGIGLYSADDINDSAYYTLSGTSMSTPNVSGSLNLLVRYYESVHNDTTPLASTMKALLINTADEAGPDPGPDYMFGWGLMNTLEAALTIQADSATGGVMIEDYLADSEVDTFVLASDGITPICVTVAWTDPPGTSPPASLDPPDLMLVNDLDLRLEHMGSLTTFFPWVLDPANPSSAATTGDNYRDNVEQVYIVSPPAGIYAVTVSHKGTLASGQYYSLVCSRAHQVSTCRAWYVSTTGSDETGDGSAGNPFRSIWMAHEVASDGDSIMVAAGTYYDFSCSKSLTIIGEGAGSTIIDGSFFSGIMIWDAAAGEITGFTIRDGSDAGIFLVTHGAGNWHIHDNVFFNNGRGIRTEDTGLVERNLFYNNTFAIEVASGGDVDIYNNSFRSNLAGIVISPGSGRADMQNNIITENGYGATNVSDSISIFDYNCVWGNTEADYYDGVSPGPNDINADPMFVGGSPFDYHLRCNSPCIDAGNPVFRDDPDGTPVDMGVFYFDQSEWFCVDTDDDCYGDPGNPSNTCPDDNCPDVYNPDQAESDGDGVGDACDICPGFSDFDDFDMDGVPDSCDNCPELANADQEDINGNEIGDACEGCCGFWTGGITGNANCSDDGKLTLSDISRMIDRVYISKALLCCEAAGNTNADIECKITLSDISRLIDVVYISKVPPEPCMPECEP